MQDFLTICAGALRHCVDNDNLREIFIGLLYEKMDEFNQLCFFGRKKGCLQILPLMPIQ